MNRSNIVVSDCTVINSTEFGVSCNIVDGMGMQELAHKQELCTRIRVSGESVCGVRTCLGCELVYG